MPLPAARAQASAESVPSGLEDCFTLAEIEAVARARVPKDLYDWIAGGGANQNTVKWNRKAYGRIKLRPRALVDVSKIDTRITLLGQELPFPILLAPTGGHKLFHPEGELATIRGAGAASAAAVVSSASTFPIDEVVRNSSAPVWFQLFIKPDRALTQDLVERAQAAGCRAFCVTVDDPITASVTGRGGLERPCLTSSGRPARAAVVLNSSQEEITTLPSGPTESPGKVSNGCAPSPRCRCCSRAF